MPTLAMALLANPRRHLLEANMVVLVLSLQCNPLRPVMSGMLTLVKGFVGDLLVDVYADVLLPSTKDLIITPCWL